MLILAHRGYHAKLPENTLAAFDAAVSLGVDGIETDIQVTRDDVPILFHDLNIQGLAIADLTHAELCRFSGRAVPTLASALDAWPDLFWNLEIKMPTRWEKVWPVLRRYGAKRRLLVSSFWHPLAVRGGTELGLECGLLLAHRPLAFSSLLAGLPADLPHGRVSVVWEFHGVDAGLIDEAAAMGMKSCVYGPRTPADHVALTTWNLAAVITDEPALTLIRS